MIHSKFCFSTVKIENPFEHFCNNVLGTKNNVVEYVSNGLVGLYVNSKNPIYIENYVYTKTNN